MGRSTADSQSPRHRIAAAIAALFAATVSPTMARAAAATPAATPAPADSASADTSQLQEVVIVGERRAAQAAIAEKRKADQVTDVITADDLGQMPDATVADALARIPGMSVIVDQSTGQGQYVGIRGLSGTYNVVTIDGVRAPQTNTDSRDVSLSLLPPNGLAAVVVSKTLTPDMDGDAIGGSIDFRTPTAFDFPGAVARVYASGGFNDRAEDAGEPSTDGRAQVDLGTRFGAGNRYGIFVSGNYGVVNLHNEEVENDGSWEPYIWRADSTEKINTNSMQLPGIDLDYRTARQTPWGMNLSLDFHGDTTQAYLHLQFASLKKKGTNDYTDFRNRGTTRLVQVDQTETDLPQPEDVITGTGANGRVYGYTTAQIVDADGDGVITDADRTSSGYWSLAGKSGVWDPQAMQFARNWETQDNTQTMGMIAIGGTSELKSWTLDYDLDYAGGANKTPHDYSISYNCDACTSPLSDSHITWVFPDPRFPQPVLSAAATNVEHDASLLPFDGASLEREKQTDSRVGFRLDGRYDRSGRVDYVKSGFKFNRSHREYNYTPVWDGDFSGTDLDGLNLEQSGLVDREVKHMLGGRYYYGDVFNRARVIAAIDAARALNPTDYSDDDRFGDDTQGNENVYALYALAHADAGATQWIAGARVEHRDVHNRFWVSDDDADNTGFDTTDKGYTVVLPSVTATWRPDDARVFRGALWSSYSPPEYTDISGGSTVTRDAGTNEIISISQGNPDLKPARSYNADLSMEYYIDQSSMVSATGYFKWIDDFIFTNGNSVSATTSRGEIEITEPRNGNKATVLGTELSLVKSLEGLAAPFDGFGVQLNATFQHTRAESGLDYRDGEKLPLPNAPSEMYNASVTYQKYATELRLSYTFRGRYLESLRSNALDKWVQHNRSVDFHSRYNFSQRMAVEFNASNLFDDWRYYTTRGSTPGYQKDYMEPGRTFELRTSYSF